MFQPVPQDPPTSRIFLWVDLWVVFVGRNFECVEILWVDFWRSRMATKSGPHVIHRLSPLVVKNTRKPGRYADGGNLYLQISSGGAKSWLFRFHLDGRSREMGLGPLHLVDLDTARQLAKAHRQNCSPASTPSITGMQREARYSPKKGRVRIARPGSGVARPTSRTSRSPS